MSNTIASLRKAIGCSSLRVRYLTLPITSQLDGLEVNTLLRRELGLSGTILRRVKWLPDGITVDGVRVHARHRVRQGQRLQVRLSDPEHTPQPLPAHGPLELVYEDADLAVVNKCPGVLVHPSHGHFSDTVGNFLMARYRAQGEASGFHPVHRLDKGTSGLLVTSKHPHGQQRLAGQLHTGRFRRIYLAVCHGAPTQQVIDAPIGRAPDSLIARRIDPAGQSARTRCQVVRTFGDRSLIRLELDTGRTHQIRVHLAHIGCPLLGDTLYGQQGDPIHRPALHSAQVELAHPITGARLVLQAPLPQDMANLL